MNEESNLSHAALQQLHKKQKEIREQKYLDGCKKRLETIASKKMTTAFIGAIDAFEQSFSFLWGGKDGPSSKEEEQWHELWQRTRTAVLDNGHSQLRGLLNEIENHIIYWKKYHMTLPVITSDQTKKD